MVRLALAVALALVGASTPSLGATIHGASRSLGIRFSVLGGRHWCGAHVKVRLKAATARVYRPRSKPFELMIGRIRAVVASECPQVSVISFSGLARRRAAFSGESSRLASWRLISLDADTGVPVCPADADAGCPGQAESYALLRDLTGGPGFDKTILTNFMQPGAHDLQFKSDNVVGKLRVVSRDTFAARFPTATSFAKAILSGVGGQCQSGGGKIENAPVADHGDTLGRAALTCRSPGQPTTRDDIVVWMAQGQYRVFSLLAEGVAGRAETTFGDQLVRAIRANGAGVDSTRR